MVLAITCMVPQQICPSSSTTSLPRAAVMPGEEEHGDNNRSDNDESDTNTAGNHFVQGVALEIAVDQSGAVANKSAGVFTRFTRGDNLCMVHRLRRMPAAAQPPRVVFENQSSETSEVGTIEWWSSPELDWPDSDLSRWP